MVQIFISAGHGGIESGGFDSGTVAGGTTESKEMELTRNLIVSELTSHNAKVLSIPDKLSLRESIAWINARAEQGDVALEIHADEASPSARGASVFYIDGNDERRDDARVMLNKLIDGVRGLTRHGSGVKPDTDSEPGSLGICRQVTVPSLLMEVGFLSNTQDRDLLQNNRSDFSRAIANGLLAWSAIEASRKGLSPTSTSSIPSSEVVVQNRINVLLEGQLNEDKGILVNDNAYVPIDLVDKFGVNAVQDSQVRRVSYQNMVYARAVDLQKFNISVEWNSTNRTLSLSKTILSNVGKLQIMGLGQASAQSLKILIESGNPNGLMMFPNLPELYQEEATAEKVNADIAFCQMCLETGFLAFGNDVDPRQNNFCGLGATGGGVVGASFPDSRTGVRAHVQHLKAYASTEPLVRPVVDPRFNMVARGVAPTITDLAGRWAVDPEYGVKILSLLRRLYNAEIKQPTNFSNTDIQLTRDFKLSEFTQSTTASTRGINNTPNAEEISHLRKLCDEILQPARSALGPIQITSGFRSEKLNELVGGVPNSDHRLGYAADIIPTQVSKLELARWIKRNTSFDQLILEFGEDNNPAWIHVSAHPRQRQEILRAIGNPTQYKAWDV
jgi:hypothetical protein